MLSEPTSVFVRCWAASRFEARRSISLPRLATWCLLVMFPVGILSVFRYMGEAHPTNVWAVMFFLLIPEALCLLALLLWVAPMLQSELDGKTWPYLAVRPHGRLIMYFGKYFNGIAWSMAAGLASLTLGILIVSPLMADPLQMWASLAALVFLACCGYGALYSLIAVVIPKRAILIAVAYTLIGEVVIGTLPAVVCEVTLQFHFRCLLREWVDFKINSADARLLFSAAPAWQHLAICSGMTLGFLGMGAWVISRREYSVQDEA